MKIKVHHSKSKCEIRVTSCFTFSYSVHMHVMKKYSAKPQRICTNFFIIYINFNFTTWIISVWKVLHKSSNFRQYFLSILKGIEQLGVKFKSMTTRMTYILSLLWLWSANNNNFSEVNNKRLIGLNKISMNIILLPHRGRYIFVKKIEISVSEYSEWCETSRNMIFS